ncbi:hypothetical protein [Burkholderia phage BCSR5]|nr:hypothetical protein [Burkholderia phage BCSR5]
MTKTELMALIAASNDGMHESFEHETSGIFDITEMRAWAKTNLEPVAVEIAQVLPALLECRYYDTQRVLELSADSWQNDPGLVVQYDDGSHLVIDGIHRTIRRAMAGETLMPMYLVPEAHIIRPDDSEWGRGEEIGIAWGDHPSPLTTKNGAA